MHDDSDMKIVQPVQTGGGDDREEAPGEMGLQHFNGNYAKAKEIGTNIVSAFSYKAAPDELLDLLAEYGVQPAETVLRQVRFLSVFSAECCLNLGLPSRMLSGVAVGKMYDVLKRVSPEIYAELAQSSAFSFYYMALRRPEGDGVGRQFAQLCGEPGNDALIKLGTRLHELNCEVYNRAIRDYSFV